MQREELSDSRNRQAAPGNQAQNEDQIWQRANDWMEAAQRKAMARMLTTCENVLSENMKVSNDLY
jgi:hypothetical protein